MSDKTRVHKLHADVALEAEQRYYQCATTLALASSEDSDHLYLRLLSFALFFEPDLKIEQGQEHRDLPDLYTEDGRWALFIGIPEANRLKRLSHHFTSLNIIIFADQLHTPEFQPHLFQYLPVWCLDRGLVRALEEENELNHHWSLSFADEQLDVTTRHSNYSGRLVLWAGMRTDHETKLHLSR